MPSDFNKSMRATQEVYAKEKNNKPCSILMSHHKLKLT